jgi:single-strand DNA-binding protein
MPSYNKVIFMGNMTRDPLVKVLTSQTPVCEFGLAMSHKFRTQAGEDREEVTFVDCAAFGKTAEVIAKFFSKGKPIFVEGRLKLDSWEDKNGGGKRTKLSVVVERFQFVGGNKEGGAAPRSNQGDIPDAPTGEAGKFTDDDIPF